MRNPFADNWCKILNKHFGVGLCINVNYLVIIIEKLSRSGNNKGLVHKCNSKQHNCALCVIWNLIFFIAVWPIENLSLNSMTKASTP